MNHYADMNLKMGCAGGTMMAFLVNISADDIIRTILLTAMGATVSFFISLLLKQVLKWYRTNRHKL